MNDLLYADKGRIYCNQYMEIYIPMEYFDNEIAVNRGGSIETFGIVYCRAFPDGKAGNLKLFNLPVITNFNVYETRNDEIIVNDKALSVMVLQYLKDSYIVHQTLPKGRDVANMFLDTMLGGKLPKTINYDKIMDIWWKNLEVSGISYKVPSKIFEMIVASIYRNPRNTKQRYGQYYGKQVNPNGLDYKTGNVRSVVKDLSTFSGMVFEDIGTMISNGINNSIDEVDEPVSPLEKIIHY